MDIVEARDLIVGQPIQFSVYDKQGVMLLRSGYVIHEQRQVERLLSMQLYKKVDSSKTTGDILLASPISHSKKINAFILVNGLKEQLRVLFDACRAGRIGVDFINGVENISEHLQEVINYDMDAVLANLHLDHVTDYAVMHALQVAAVYELSAQKQNVPKEERLMLIRAALTHDIGLIDIQDDLERQTSSLTAVQHDRIRSHPIDGVEILKRLGVTNPVWLNAVLQHHERLDGSGYPYGCKNDEINFLSRILAVADTYAAMTRERPYRKAMISKEAMRSMLVDAQDKIDRRISEITIKSLGIFPPGTIVKLVNMEVGVVVRRGENALNPIVYVFVGADGIRKASSLKRDTKNKEYEIDWALSYVDYGHYMKTIQAIWRES